jgi:hypothetical protein
MTSERGKRCLTDSKIIDQFGYMLSQPPLYEDHTRVIAHSRKLTAQLPFVVEE